MKFACSSNMIEGDSLIEKAEKLAKWGYDGISIFFDYADWNESVLDELLHIKEKTGVTPCEFAFGDEIYGHLMDPDLKLRERCREMYKIAAEVSAKLGAVTEYEFAYGPQSPLPLFHPYQQMDKEEDLGFLQLTKELAEPLKGSEGYLLLEGINRYESPYMNGLKDCKDVMERYGIENTGLLADFFHMSIEEASMPGSILYCGDMIRHVHLGDNNRLLPGYGSTNWDACFGALKEIGYNGFLNLECATCGDPEETLPRELEFLHKLAK